MIPADEILLGAPAVSGGPPAADVLISAGEALDGVLAAVELRFEQTLGEGGQISKPTVVRAVSLMHELASPVTTGEFWSSATQVDSLPLLWDDAKIERLQGTHAGELIESLRAEALLICDVVVVPSIPVAQAGHFTAVDSTLGKSFMRAVALLRSRCLPSDEVSVGPMSSAQHFCRFGALAPGAPVEGEVSNPLDRVAVRLSPRILRRAGGEEHEEANGDEGDVGDQISSPSVELRKRVLAVVGFQGDVAEIGAFELTAAELDGYRCVTSRPSLSLQRSAHHRALSASLPTGPAPRVPRRSGN